jgi:hypothetical protein
MVCDGLAIRSAFLPVLTGWTVLWPFEKPAFPCCGGATTAFMFSPS